MRQLLRVLLMMIRRGILQLVQLKLMEVGGRCGKLLLVVATLRLIAAAAATIRQRQLVRLQLMMQMIAIAVALVHSCRIRLLV